jgi:hypothetical protein
VVGTTGLRRPSSRSLSRRYFATEVSRHAVNDTTELGCRIEFGTWEREVSASLEAILGAANLSRSQLASGLIVWRLTGSSTVTAGPEDHSGLVYLSFSDDLPAMMIALDAGTDRAARYIATRLTDR